MKDTMSTMLDLKGPHAPVIAKLNIPGSFVILDRIVWGVSALLGKLDRQCSVACHAAGISSWRIRQRPSLGEAEQSWLRQRHGWPKCASTVTHRTDCCRVQPLSSQPRGIFTVADPYKPRAPFAPWDRRTLPGLFDVEESARRVGNYKWAEMKLFEALGGWVATVPSST